MSTAIVWFRRDLRLADHPALHAAVASHDHVVALYVHAVYFNRLYEPHLSERDVSVRRALEADGIAVESFNASLWCEPGDLLNKQDEPYRVFTPFWRNLRTRIEERAPLPTPQRIPFRHPDERFAGNVATDALNLLPRHDWARGFADWTPGEHGAREMLELFADDALGHYAEGRDLPARHGTSRLSPHLHWGEISPVQIHAHAVGEVRSRRGIHPSMGAGAGERPGPAGARAVGRPHLPGEFRLSAADRGPQGVARKGTHGISRLTHTQDVGARRARSYGFFSRSSRASTGGVTIAVSSDMATITA